MIKLVKSTFFDEVATKRKLNKFIKESSQLSFGKECINFEKKFASWQKRKHCIFLNSGSSANLAIIQTLLNLGRIKKGDNIGFSALTWSTNVMPLIQLGFNPIPIDVELNTLNVSSKQLQSVLKNKKLKALFLTNALGFCDDLEKVEDLCKKNNILLIEDNCESLGTVYKGKMLGNYGVLSSFSFYVGHHMSTIEGGAVCTDDDELATMLRIVRAHGWDRNLDFAKQSEIRKKFKVSSTFYSRYTFYDLGYNLRPTEISGFIGNIQIKHLDYIIKKRNENFLEISKVLYNNPKYYPIKHDHISFVSNFSIPIICRTKDLRNELVKQCRKKIEIRPIIGGDMQVQPFFQKYSKGNSFKSLNAKLIHEQGFYFGNNPELTKKEIKYLLHFFK